MKKKVFASMLSSDFSNIAQQLKKLEDSGVDGLHIDIMDGHFVKNFSMGPKMVEAIRKNTNLFLDVHLMVYNPFDYIERFIAAGADAISFHLEATEDVKDTLNYIKKCSKKAGLAINPETPFSMILQYIDMCNFVLLMSVTPGFGGQKFQEEVLEKIGFIRKFCNTLNIKNEGEIIDEKDKKNYDSFEIQVDGGINVESAKLCLEKGATTLISGDYLFNQEDMKKAVLNLKKL